MKNNNQHHKNLSGSSPKQVPLQGVFVKSTPDRERHQKTMVSGGVDALTMRQISNQNLNDGCIQLDKPTITVTSDILDILRYEGPLRSKLGRGKKPSKKN